jgi:mRNA interferase MazF
MTTFNRGDVFYVRFQFTNRAAAKNRPAVIISSDSYHASRDDVIITGITTNLDRTDFVGQMNMMEWQSAGLREPSAISGIIMTVRSNVFSDRVGSLSTADLERLDASLRESLGLGP